MISLNATIFVQVALFLILVFVLNRIMIRPLHQLIIDREETIKNKEDELDRATAELQRMVEDYERRLQQAETDARQALLNMRREAGEQAHAAIKGAHEQVMALREKVRREVAEELERARDQVRGQAEALSFEITTKLVGRKV